MTLSFSEFWRYMVSPGVNVMVTCNMFNVPSGERSNFGVVERETSGSGEVLFRDRRLQTKAADGRLEYIGMAKITQQRFIRFNVS